MEERVKSRQALWQEKQKAEGRCVRCGEPAARRTIGKQVRVLTQCESCRNKRRRLNAEAWARLKAAKSL